MPQPGLRRLSLRALQPCCFCCSACGRQTLCASHEEFHGDAQLLDCRSLLHDLLPTARISRHVSTLLGHHGGIWIYDLLVKHASLERTGQHNAFAVLLLAMPLIYPLCSLALGHEFPMMTSPVMPCSVAVFTIGLMLAFSEQVNIVLAMFLCHWALIGLSKVYFFGIPEDYLLACSTVPALYIFFREYVRSNADRPTKPSAHVLDALLIALSLVVGIFFTVTLLHQLDLFTQII